MVEGGWKKITLAILIAFCAIGQSICQAQELLKALEPGTGYSRLKQWAIEQKLVFENFTRDSLVITGSFRESDDSSAYTIHIVSRFCAGDDYAGKAYNTTLQQFAEIGARQDRFPGVQDVFAKHRKYIDALAGKSSEDGRFSGDYKIRRERRSDLKGLAVVTSSNQGSWEVGLFADKSLLIIQVIRIRDELCK
jgi:hypothetical protein